jgi:RHS repeat-associated protein
VSDSAGALVLTIDYYPFGVRRISSGTYNEQRQYIGQVYDTETGLDYLNARYYGAGTARFISRDPMFSALPIDFIVDPQQQNSYSYARNNPIVNKDPGGLFNANAGTVEKGDTLTKITSIINSLNSTNYTIAQIANLNKINNIDRIYVGQTIKPNGAVPDVTRSLNSANQVHAAEAKGPALIGPVNANSTVSTAGMGPIQFASKFQEGGRWDLKSQRGVFCQKIACGGQTATDYIYDGQMIPGDAPGNIHYGYVGRESGYSLGALLFFSDAAQRVTNILRGQPLVGDPISDKEFIIFGYGIK